MKLSIDALNADASPLIEIAPLADQVQDPYRLYYGESDWPTPEFICRAGYEATRRGHTFYTPTAGYMELREAIASKVAELHDVGYRPSEVICTVGAGMAIFLAPGQPAPNNLPSKTKVIQIRALIVPHAACQKLPLPGARRSFKALKDLHHAEHPSLTGELHAGTSMLPAEQEVQEGCLWDGLHLFSEAAYGSPMDPGQNPPVTELLFLAARSEAPPQHKSFPFKAGNGSVDLGRG